MSPKRRLYLLRNSCKKPDTTLGEVFQNRTTDFSVSTCITKLDNIKAVLSEKNDGIANSDLLDEANFTAVFEKIEDLERTIQIKKNQRSLSPKTSEDIPYSDPVMTQ